ncbi:MAG TPA: CaiB/BaiF CoA-transferase family protein [Acidimicrobiales bacterium]|jgi:crotonobetainyl-CoA:carnitine CoA-transferase CaiB-like acyl-CoA transferase|nr:CaiB/BaiF CoA-transferase family protein [Acidimicrobiales bacterium]
MSDLLNGVRVLECAVLFNGDTVGMHLGDMGADVIKIESPGHGDYLRDMLGQIVPHHSPAHVQVNKNKRSMTLDLRRPEGLHVFWDLLRTADVFVDGFLAGACDRLGIGYAAQRAVKADIVYCHYSGFGGTGPYARIPTHGQMMNALAAAVPLAVSDDGLVRERPSTEPMGGTTIGGDGTAAGAVHAALRIAAALVRRERTGGGAYLDAAGADGVVAQGWIAAIYGLNEHRLTDRRGLRERGDTERTAAKYNFYATADDRFVLFCAIEPKFWTRFCEGVGRPDLVGELSTAGPVDFGHRDEPLRRELQAIFATRTQEEWVTFARDHRLPLGPAHQTAADLRGDPQLVERQIVVEGEHPTAGPFTYVGEAVIVDGGVYDVRRPAPALGEHTDEVLRELGRSDAEIAALRAAGVI